jgi:hypothetical protein
MAKRVSAGRVFKYTVACKIQKFATEGTGGGCYVRSSAVTVPGGAGAAGSLGAASSESAVGFGRLWGHVSAVVRVRWWVCGMVDVRTEVRLCDPRFRVSTRVCPGSPMTFYR